MVKKRNIDELSDIEYYVTQEDGTEPPFENKYWKHFEEGVYIDKLSGEVLFTSHDKFDSSCGWPSFSKAASENIVEVHDDSHGMSRTEVRSDTSHLGHVFNDGPKKSGGLRYCINSASIDFIPKSELKESGYEKWLSQFE